MAGLSNSIIYSFINVNLFKRIFCMCVWFGLMKSVRYRMHYIFFSLILVVYDYTIQLNNILGEEEGGGQGRTDMKVVYFDGNFSYSIQGCNQFLCITAVV